jgi:hypothetical protein
MQQVIGASMGSKVGPVLACKLFWQALWKWVWMPGVFQIYKVPSAAARRHQSTCTHAVSDVVDSQEWVQGQALQESCYPSSLRLLQNSLGPTQRCFHVILALLRESCCMCLCVCVIPEG